MRKENTFKFWELGTIAIKNVGKVDIKIFNMICDAYNQVAVERADTPRTNFDGFYCPKIAGGCYAYLPKHKKARNA